MAYSVAHKEECLRNAINNHIPYPESQEVANIYVDEYIQKIATDANFEIMADHLISMQYLTRYDIFLCSPSSGSGNCSHSSGSGNYSPSSGSGNCSHSSGSGNCSHSSGSGNYSHSSGSGNYSHSSGSGNCSPSSGSGDDLSFLGEGMFCECDQYKNVESTPIAQGSKNVTKFQMELWKCELAGLPVSSDKYYTPDGTSDGCVFVPPAYRYIACFNALMGTVTQCGD